LVVCVVCGVDCDVFMRMFPCSTVSLVGVIADTFTIVLSIVIDTFCDMFTRLFVFVAFVLRLYVPSVSVFELNVVFQ